MGHLRNVIRDDGLFLVILISMEEREKLNTTES